MGIVLGRKRESWRDKLENDMLNLGLKEEDTEDGQP